MDKELMKVNFVLFCKFMAKFKTNSFKGITKVAVKNHWHSLDFWVEIEDNNEVIEESLILQEAKINAENFSITGIRVNLMIVEQMDNAQTPSNYQEIYNSL